MKRFSCFYWKQKKELDCSDIKFKEKTFSRYNHETLPNSVVENFQILL